MGKIFDEIFNAVKAEFDVLFEHHPDTCFHSLRTAKVVEKCCDALSFTEQQTKDAITASILHDIGKIDIPLNILDSTSKLSDKQREKVNEHPLNSYKRLMNISEKGNQYVNENVALCACEHHEREDGKGYPDGKSSDQILKISGLLHIADVFDAIISPRTYKSGFTPEEFYKDFVNNKGIYNEETLKTVLIQVGYKQFDALRKEVEDLMWDNYKQEPPIKFEESLEDVVNGHKTSGIIESIESTSLQTFFEENAAVISIEDIAQTKRKLSELVDNKIEYIEVSPNGRYDELFEINGYKFAFAKKGELNGCIIDFISEALDKRIIGTTGGSLIFDKSNTKPINYLIQR